MLPWGSEPVPPHRVPMSYIFGGFDLELGLGNGTGARRKERKQGNDGILHFHQKPHANLQTNRLGESPHFTQLIFGSGHSQKNRRISRNVWIDFTEIQFRRPYSL